MHHIQAHYADLIETARPMARRYLGLTWVGVADRTPLVSVEERYPCPCCGHHVFLEPPGSEDICLVCFWEDDIQQLRWPTLAGLSNSVSLVEAQQNRARYGAIEERFAGDVRPALPEEPLELTFRPIVESDSFEGPDDSAPWPDDPCKLYYWRPEYWRAAPTAR